MCLLDFFSPFFCKPCFSWGHISEALKPSVLPAQVQVHQMLRTYQSVCTQQELNKQVYTHPFLYLYRHRICSFWVPMEGIQFFKYINWFPQKNLCLLLKVFWLQQLYLCLFFKNKILQFFFFFQGSFRFNVKIERKVQRFLSYPSLTTGTASTLSSTTHLTETFVPTDELTLTHSHHPKSATYLRVHSRGP